MLVLAVMLALVRLVLWVLGVTSREAMVQPLGPNTLTPLRVMIASEGSSSNRRTVPPITTPSTEAPTYLPLYYYESVGSGGARRLAGGYMYMA